MFPIRFTPNIHRKKQPGAIADRSLDACEQVMKEHGEEIAAVLVEPLIQGAAGLRTQAPGFLKGLRELCDRYEIFLIVDEVFTGFGRTGTMFACEREGVSPDLMALAKGITGGYLPLAATLATQRIFNGFLGVHSEYRTFFHGHSYTGNQLGCARGRGWPLLLDLFASDNTLERMKPVIAHLEKRLDNLFDQCDCVGDIHQCGLTAGIDLIRSRSKGEQYPMDQTVGADVCFALREYGIWLRPLGNTLVLVPPLITTIEEIDFLIDSIEDCLQKL